MRSVEEIRDKELNVLDPRTPEQKAADDAWCEGEGKSLKDWFDRIGREPEGQSLWRKIQKKWGRFQYKMNRAWWYTRGVLWDKWNVIKMPGLSPTYHDVDTRMEHGMFQLAVDYVEKEHYTFCLRPSDWADEYLDEIKEWEISLDLATRAGDERAIEKATWEIEKRKGNMEMVRLQYEGDAEVRAIYEWWTVTYPALKALPWTPRLEEQINEEMTDMLIRLVKIRRSMWT